MALLTGDVVAYRSVQAASDGGAMSVTPVSSTPLNNVWADITDAERLAGTTKYRKIFWKNTSGSDAMVEPSMYMPDLPSGVTVSIGLGFDDAGDTDASMGNMVAMTATNVVELVSSGVDSRVVTVWGLDDNGDPASEAVTLISTTPVHTTTSFSAVWAAAAAGTALANVVTVRQGVGGNTIGTIDATRMCCWLWVQSPASKTAGIVLPDLGAGGSYGLWERMVVPAGTTPSRPNTLTVAIEES